MSSLMERLDSSRRLVCGVCSKIATQFGWSIAVSRIVAAIVLVVNPSVTLLVYMVIAVLMTQRSSY
ncbi:PspC domain-containing protein [Shewanella sp. WXL01]|uniref:PspC domain-containing protein n=1 Tax=Shewanella sp. WXL01 TaxID=2709721 RepID=UPI0014383A77|nr:PspC domain-containing protein [Shewanella sp. WXL01]NKF49477.1 PspC domain-containing protein [Shewanella sp. WXL01]